MVYIRRAQAGDEETLARIQTESWRAAFAGIVPAELLTQCTNLERAIRFYEAHGFAASGKKQSALGAVEEMYVKERQ